MHPIRFIPQPVQYLPTLFLPIDHRIGAHLVNIYELVVLDILTISPYPQTPARESLTSDVLDTRVTEMSIVLIRTKVLEFGVHGGVVDLLRLAHGYTLPLSLFVEKEEDDDLDADDNDKSDKDDHDGKNTGSIPRSVLSLEQERSDDVSSSRGGVEESHNDGFLGLTGSVGNDPGHNEGVTTVQEGEEIVTAQRNRLLLRTKGNDSRLSVQHDTADDGLMISNGRCGQGHLLTINIRARRTGDLYRNFCAQ